MKTVTRTVDVIVDDHVVRSYAISVLSLFGKAVSDDVFISEAAEEASFDKAIPAEAVFLVRETQPGDEAI